MTFKSPFASLPIPGARMVGRLVLLNLVVVLLAALGIAQNRARHEERATTASKNLALVLEREIGSLIGRIDLVLLTVSDEMARLPAAAGAGSTSLDDFMIRHGQRVPEIHSLRATDTHGNVIYGRGADLEAHPNLSDRPYFQQLAAAPHPGLVISKPALSRVNGEWEIVLARRLEAPGGGFGGIVYATLTLQHFIEMFASLDMGSTGAVALRDADLHVMARKPLLTSIAADVGNSAVSPQLREPVLAGQTSGTLTATASADGIERTISFRRVSTYPLYIVVGLATGDYLAEWRNGVTKALVLLAAFMFLSILFAALLHRAWQRREGHVEALGMQERKFRTLLESSPDALVIVDAREVIAIVNRQACYMFGYPREELVGQPLDMLLVPHNRGPLTPRDVMQGCSPGATATCGPWRRPARSFRSASA